MYVGPLTISGDTKMKTAPSLVGFFDCKRWKGPPAVGYLTALTEKLKSQLPRGGNPRSQRTGSSQPGSRHFHLFVTHSNPSTKEGQGPLITVPPNKTPRPSQKRERRQHRQTGRSSLHPNTQGLPSWGLSQWGSWTRRGNGASV